MDYLGRFLAYLPESNGPWLTSNSSVYISHCDIISCQRCFYILNKKETYHFSERSQVIRQFCLHQFKCMAILLHRTSFVGSESSPDGGQIVKSHKLSFLLYYLSGIVCEILIDSVDLKVLCIFCEVYIFIIRGFQPLGRPCRVAT